MPQTPFVHLHNHSEFSLLDGATKIKDMVKYAVDNDMPAIALTDHGMMYGSFEFYQAARKAGIKPLIGVELYVATRTRQQKEAKKDGNHHLVAIAKNYAGYKNLLKLTTKASMEGFYHKPRVDKELLAEHSEGLIICSACMGGELAHAIREGKGSLEGARDTAAWYREVFGEDYYLEIQGHSAKGQAEINEATIRLAEQLGIKLVGTNDSHYLRKEDADAHDVLICIQTGTTIEDPKRMKYEPREFYLKSYDEMLEAFRHCPSAIENTIELADKVDLTIETGRVPMPSVALPDGKTVHGHMTDLCREGLERRIKNVSQVHRDRLDYELGIIDQTGFSQYFLIVMDISNYARSSGIYFGVRGSAAGSLASYCLGITDLDPIEYDLTFERFLNPERITMPDIDMDFQDDKRADVIAHVVEQYGKDNVAYITTFGTMGAKAALRDAGRALALPLPEVDRIARMIPALPLGITIDKAMHGWEEKDYPGNPEFAADYQNNPVCTRLVDTAKRLEGMSRNASVHAAGIMVADRPLVEYTPLEMRNGQVVTQFPHSSLESIGLLKLDFLGLVNLTILAKAVKLIKEKRGETVDVWDIPLDYDGDPRAKKAYDMLGRGETTGVFQLESAGMRKYIVGLKPNSVKELAAMVALYRPGPLAHIPRFIESKFNPDKIKYAHPLLEPILKDTYGVIVYQDQVLKIVQAIAGFSLGQADILRRAMGKKQRKYMDEQKVNVLKGAAERGVKASIAEQIFADIEPFAGYAFNGCLSGRTYVRKADGSRIQLSAAYTEQTPELMAMWEDGTVRPHRVERIVSTGRKETVRIRTQGKRTVIATLDHRFLTTDGYKSVREMEVGTELIVTPRPTSERQRAARRINAGVAGRSEASRIAVSARMKAYQQGLTAEEKTEHMRRVHALHPLMWQKGQQSATERVAYLHENDPEWRKAFIEKSFASVRAAYDTGPGYGHCSVASNGMWCASLPERAMCEWLAERAVDFEMHKVLPNGRICPFYFGGIYWEMDGMDRQHCYFEEKYGALPFVVVTPEDFKAVVARHTDLEHAENGDPIISIEPFGVIATYDVEMAENGPKNFIANTIVSHNSHAACYAMVAYQTAYLKANYSAEYLAALMGAYVDNTEKIVNTIEECDRLGVKVLPPDINESDADFSVGTDGSVRFGLMAIKNVGKAPIEATLAARESGGKFASLEDYCNRVFAEGMTSKSVIEMLIKCGALASLTQNRRALLESLDDCASSAARGAKDAKAGLISLFGEAGGSESDAVAVNGVTLPAENVTDFSRGERLSFEKELLGIYLTEHPIKPFENELKRKYKTMRIEDIKETTPNQDVVIGGMVTNVKTVYTKEGKQMLIVGVEDTSGSTSLTLFPKTAAEFGRFVIQNAVVAIRGRAQHRERFAKSRDADAAAEEGAEKNVQIEIMVQHVTQVIPDAMAADARTREVYVRLDSSAKTLLRMVHDTFRANEGGSPLFLRLETPSGEYTVKTKLMVSPDEQCLDQVRKMLGGGARRAWIE